MDMIFDTFDKKAVEWMEKGDFREKIFENEVVWTYAIAKLAMSNAEIYEKLTKLNYDTSHSIYLEVQPKTIYSGLEGNSVIDLAAGNIQIRDNTASGIELINCDSCEVCFAEAKYNSDLSVKTSHCVTRNQMDRVLENLLVFQRDSKPSSKIVFALLTPRIYKDIPGTRIYAYKFKEYQELLYNDKKLFADRIKLSTYFEPAKQMEHNYRFEDILSSLELNWITFEDLIEIEFEDEKNLDITDYNQAEKIWRKLREKILNKG